MKTNPQQEILKTSIAMVAAVAMVGTTAGVYYATQPKKPDVYAKVDQPFFQDFQSAQQIQAMTLTARDSEGALQNFRLAKQEGLWVIPSHSNYPAEAGQRLSQVATSLLGLSRLQLASLEEQAQQRLGVLDPSSDAAADQPDAAGKLIEFKDVNDETLFQLIVGKKVEKDQNLDVYQLEPDSDDGPRYYVRVPGEKETYVTSMDLDISTKFSDWINSDLLEVTSPQLRKMELDNYRLETRQAVTQRGITLQRQMVREGQVNLQRASSTEPWTLDQMPADKEVDSEKVGQIVDTIQSLELIDVRPQFLYEGQSLLNNDLSVNLPPSLEQNPQAAGAVIEQLQDDLTDAGFAIAQGVDGNPRMVAENGEMKVTSNEGIIYTLLYGSEVTIANGEIAIRADSSNNAEGDSEQENDDTAAEAEKNQTGRLVCIRVAFHEDAVEGKPVPPQEPVKPELPEDFGQPQIPVPGFDAPPVPKSSGTAAQPDATAPDAAGTPNLDANAPDSTNQTTGESTEGRDDASGGLFAIQDPVSDADGQQDNPGESTAPALSPREMMMQQLDAMHQQQMQQYQQEMQTYQTSLKTYQERVEQFKKKAERLQQRFSHWYYVVPNKDLAVLRLSQEALLKEKSAIDEQGQLNNPVGLPPGFDPSQLLGQ